MTEFDIKYIELLKRILNEGIEVENRTGVNTIKIDAHSFKFDLRKEFPILETKQTFYKNAIIEMLWIWQIQSNNVKDLQERGVNIWNKWMVDEDGIYRIYEQGNSVTPYDPDREVTVYDVHSLPVDDPFNYRKEMVPKLNDNGEILTAKSLIEGKNIKEAKYYGKEYANTIGTAYGYITNRYKFTQELIDSIKNHPNDRRKVYSLWQNEFLRTAVLPSCVWSTEWNVVGDTLNLQVHQRSCDTPLGLPFNVTQYATLLKMIAQVTDKEPGILSYSINDPHIYINQINGINEQLRRAELYNYLSTLSVYELLKRKEVLEKDLKLLNKESEMYKRIDTSLRIIDIILYPTKPELVLDDSVDDFFQFDNSRELKHVKVRNYKHMGKITFPISQ